MTPPRLLLNTPKAARLTLARLMRKYLSGDLTRDKFRDAVYGMHGILAFFKHEADMQIEDRLEEIEKTLEGQRNEAPSKDFGI